MKGLRQLIKEFAMEEDAVGVVEIILILVVLLVALFQQVYVGTAYKSC